MKSSKRHTGHNSSPLGSVSVIGINISPWVGFDAVVMITMMMMMLVQCCEDTHTLLSSRSDNYPSRSEHKSPSNSTPVGHRVDFDQVRWFVPEPTGIGQGEG